MHSTYLNDLRLPIEVLCALREGIKALGCVNPSCYPLWEEAALSVLGSHCQDVQVLHTRTSEAQALMLSRPVSTKGGCFQTYVHAYVGYPERLPTN